MLPGVMLQFHLHCFDGSIKTGHHNASRTKHRKMRMNSKAYWNSAAGKKEFTIPLPIAELVPLLHPESAVLDFGCGYGRTLLTLREHGFLNFHGTDIAEAMIGRAREALPEADLRLNEGTSIPWPDAFFDAVILCGVLTCIPGKLPRKRR